MKQQNNLWDKIASLEYIEIAHNQAKRKKAHYTEVKWVEANKKLAFRYIRFILSTGRFKTSPYKEKHINRGNKDRVIHKLPYFPDRIVQHLVVNACKDVWVKRFIRDTFQSIPGRGTTDCARRVRKKIKEYQPKYAMKVDINKFYPSVDTCMLVKNNVFRVKCKKTKQLLDNILTSLPFLPLGNHISQYAGNLLLSPLDWKLKQQLKVKMYFRYCDDLVILSDSKLHLKHLYRFITQELSALGLSTKPPEIISLDESYLDFVGYRFNKKEILLRKSIATNIKRNTDEEALPSFFGWCKHSNSISYFNKNKG